MAFMAFNMSRSLDFDHNRRQLLREDARLVHIEKKRSLLSCFAFNYRQESGSVQRFDALEAYVYLVKLRTLHPLDMLSVELEVILNLGLPQVRPKLTVTHNTLNVLLWTVEIELPKDARCGLDAMTFGLREDDTFMIVVPREASGFRRAVERMKKIIAI